jgi:hypothetical protein
MINYFKNLINTYKENKQLKLLEHRKLQQEELEHQELLHTKKQVEDYIYFNGVNFTRDFEFLINIIEYYISMHIEVNALILGAVNISTSDEEFKLSVAEYSLKIFNRLSLFQKELLYMYLKDEDELLDFIISRIYKVIGTYEIIKNNTLTKK